jgi:hypothetical protein
MSIGPKMSKNRPPPAWGLPNPGSDAAMRAELSALNVHAGDCPVHTNFKTRCALRSPRSMMMSPPGAGLARVAPTAVMMMSESGWSLTIWTFPGAPARGTTLKDLAVMISRMTGSRSTLTTRSTAGQLNPPLTMAGVCPALPSTTKRPGGGQAAPLV